MLVSNFSVFLRFRPKGRSKNPSSSLIFTGGATTQQAQQYFINITMKAFKRPLGHVLAPKELKKRKKTEKFGNLDRNQQGISHASPILKS